MKDHNINNQIVNPVIQYFDDHQSWESESGVEIKISRIKLQTFSPIANLFELMGLPSVDLSLLNLPEEREIIL